jgi:hypothetical protein
VTVVGCLREMKVVRVAVSGGVLRVRGRRKKLGNVSLCAWREGATGTDTVVGILWLSRDQASSRLHCNLVRWVGEKSRLCILVVG